MAAFITKQWKIALLWLISLVFVGGLSAFAAQRSLPLPPTTLPQIVSGNDVGFRIDRMREGVPMGTIVVRVNGAWVEPVPSTARPTR